jgi:predicted phosphodiesterase
MRVQLPVRDRNMSLWQSAVRRALTKYSLSDHDKKRIEYGVSLHAHAMERGSALPSVADAPDGPADTGPTSPAHIAHASKAAFDALQAHHGDDGDAHSAMFRGLSDFVSKYSTWDVAGWIQAGWYYVKYYVLAHMPPSYRNWQTQIPPDINFGMIPYRLPANGRVLVIGDWGTHMPDNRALLRQALKTFSPDVIIHLGDVYYSGTVEECTENVLDVMNRIVADLKLDKRPPFFTIPGNHDYYSGGAGFYETIDKINAGIDGCTQQASYFCLRSADDRWQFLGMDTGHGDRNPVDQHAPTLQDSEMQWHRDKLETFAGSTILLSHHQLVSAKERLNTTAHAFLNEHLYALFKQYFDRVAAWYWGHEHNFVIFQNDLPIRSDEPALRKGRLVGCSAYEETLAEDPYEINNPEARFIADMPRLQHSKWKTDTQNFYNHAFAILDVAPDKIAATYYEYPSWGEDSGPASDPEIGEPIYREEVPYTRPAGATAPATA